VESRANERGFSLWKATGAPGLDLIQRTQGPLGRSRLGELLAWHVQDRARILDATATATATAAADAGSQAATEGAAAAA
jgi:hypothetical protein